MSVGSRRLLVAAVLVVILSLANAGTIVGWLQDLGVIPFAQYLRSEYITGTAIAVIMALLILLPGRAVWAICARRCPVCHSPLLRHGKYCAECGSRA